MFKYTNYLAAYLMVYLSCSIELTWQRHSYRKHAIGIDAAKQPLYCFSCNANAEFCAPGSLDLNRLRVEHYVPCNGRCMQYRNKNDNQSRKLNRIFNVLK